MNRLSVFWGPSGHRPADAYCVQPTAGSLGVCVWTSVLCVRVLARMCVWGRGRRNETVRGVVGRGRHPSCHPGLPVLCLRKCRRLIRCRRRGATRVLYSPVARARASFQPGTRCASAGNEPQSARMLSHVFSIQRRACYIVYCCLRTVRRSTARVSLFIALLIPADHGRPPDSPGCCDCVAILFLWRHSRRNCDRQD